MRRPRSAYSTMHVPWVRFVSRPATLSFMLFGRAMFLNLSTARRVRQAGFVPLPLCNLILGDDYVSCTRPVLTSLQRRSLSRAFSMPAKPPLRCGAPERLWPGNIAAMSARPARALRSTDYSSANRAARIRRGLRSPDAVGVWRALTSRFARSSSFSPSPLPSLSLRKLLVASRDGEWAGRASAE